MSNRNLSGFPLNLDMENNTNSESDELVYDETMEHLYNILSQTHFFVANMLMPIVAFFGTFCNILNIIVLTRPKMQTSINYYLTTLAVCDTLYLLFAVSLTLQHHFEELESNTIYIIYQFLIGIPCTNLFSNIGVWITVAFTIERYIGICHPMKEKKWCSKGRTKCAIICLITACVFLAVPNIMEYQVVNEAESGIFIKLSGIGEHVAYSMGYIWFSQTLFAFIPLLILFVLNTVILIGLRKAEHRRHEMLRPNVSASPRGKMMKGHGEKHKITVMLLVVVIVFMICQVPQACVHLYWNLITTIGTASQYTSIKVAVFNNICNLLVMVNASTNFMLYSLFSERFRDAVKLTFVCKGKKQAHSKLNKAMIYKKVNKRSLRKLGSSMDCDRAMLPEAKKREVMALHSL